MAPQSTSGTDRTGSPAATSPTTRLAVVGKAQQITYPRVASTTAISTPGSLGANLRQCDDQDDGGSDAERKRDRVHEVGAR